MNKWTKIFSTPVYWQAQLLKSVLENHEIACFVLEKRDAYNLTGSYELHTQQDNALMARHLITHER